MAIINFTQSWKKLKWTKAEVFATVLVFIINHYAHAQTSFTTLRNLRCEYSVSPISVDEPRPGLSWNIYATNRNWQQQAYQILVASSKGLLEKNRSDLWDSKKTNSSASVQIEYGGKPLSSYQVVYWKVKVWDQYGHSSGWSPVAKWAMGILNEHDWKANWIGRKNHVYNEYDNNLYDSNVIWADNPQSDRAKLRKMFQIPTTSNISDAYLLFAARNSCMVFFNGIAITKDQPGDLSKALKKVDLKSLVKAGNNLLAFDISGKDRSKGLLCRLLIRYQNGDSVIVRSDGSWKSNALENTEFSNPTTNDISWPAARIQTSADAKTLQKSLLHAPQVDPAPYLRKEFILSGNIKRARLYTSAPGFAELRLNGIKIGGNEERNPGFTRFDKRLLYSVYDVSGQIKPGKNALGAILGTGWYDVHDQATWLLEKAPWRGRPRIKLQLYIEYANGKTATIISDSSWKASTGPILFDGIYTGEIYDANKELPGWDKGMYNDSRWENAVIMPDPGGKMVALKCPPVGIDSVIKPESITEPKPGVYIVNMGQNFSGHTQLRVKAPKGTRISMRYAEVLNNKGMLETGNIEQFMAPSNPRQPFQTDTYICKGTGTEVWEQRFSYSGFQYVEVTGLPFKPKLDNFRGKFAHTLFEADGAVKTSDTLVNRIQQIVQRGYLSNAQNIPTDCPQREKNGWTGDAHLAAETGIMNYNTASFYTKWLDDQADAQLTNGLIPVIVPSADWGLHWEPEWNSAYHLIAWYLYEYYGDKSILEKHYPHLKLYLDSLAAKRRDGLIPGGSYGDWDPLVTTTSKKLTANAYLFADADIVSKIAGLLHLQSDSVKYRGMADDIKRHFNKEFFNSATAIYENGSQCAMSLPLYFDMVAAEYRSKVEENMVRHIASEPHIDAGILGTKNILRALSEAGRTDLAYEMVDRKEFPGWGYWITQGATSSWGGWGKPGVKNIGSLNHIMYGDVSAWLFNNVAGITPDPTSPGFKHFVIRPGIVGDLTWVTAHYNSVHGQILVSWKKTNSAIIVNAVIPANMSASIVLPAESVSAVREGGGPVSEAKGIKVLKQEKGLVYLEAGSGDYHFAIQ